MDSHVKVNFQSVTLRYVHDVVSSACIDIVGTLRELGRRDVGRPTATAQPPGGAWNAARCAPGLAVLCAAGFLACGGSGPSPADAGADMQRSDAASDLAPADLPAADASSLGPGTYTRTVPHGGMNRTYILVVPEGYVSTAPAPLLLSLHPNNTTASGWSNGGNHMQRSATAQGVIVAFPAGFDPDGTGGSWNATYCCGEAHGRNVDDVGFLRAVIQDVRSVLRVNDRRIYAHGYSNGGSMAHRLGTELSDTLAAIGEFAGTIGGLDQSDAGVRLPVTPTSPLSVLMIHGRSDPTVPYEGTPRMSPARPAHIGSREAIGWWAMQNGCAMFPNSTTMGPVQTDDFPSCRAGRQVRLLSIEGLDHSYPVGPRFDATDTILAFLLAQQRP